MPSAALDESRWSSRRALVYAAIVLHLVDNYVPFGHYLLYPFTLLSTWVHEMGHGLGALAVGGDFRELHVYGDAGGLAFTSSAPGWPDGVLSAAGLVAPPLAGAAMLAIARGPRRARIVLGVLTATLLASLVLWVRTTVGWVVFPALAIGIGLAALRLGPNRVLLLAQLVGLSFALDTITRIDYLFAATATVAGEVRKSDIARVAEAFGGARLLWGLLLAALSLLLLALGLWASWWKKGSRARPRRG
jgi:hypothetical protein